MPTSRLSIGHTAITWRDSEAEAGVKCIAELGFHAIEIFAWVLKALRDQGRDDVCARYGIPLISSYYSIDIVDPAKRDAEMAKLSEWTDIAAGLGAKFATFGGNGVDRRGFVFRDHKQYLVEFVNEAARRVQDKGMLLNFHPHTGTPVQTEAEIVEFLDAVDTRYVGFAPDLGQIQKGGSDPMRFLKDYIGILRLVHFKDYSGRVEFDADGQEIDTSGYACYAPLGQGVVDLAGVMAYLEQSPFMGPVMVELDAGKDMPLTPEAAVSINRAYMEGLGYRFPARGGRQR